jgi:malic enzyme
MLGAQLLHDHLPDMFSVVYTPTEGEAIQNFSHIFRRPVGCFLNIHDPDRVHQNLAQWGQPQDIDYIVVTGPSLIPSPVILPTHFERSEDQRKS